MASDSLKGLVETLSNGICGVINGAKYYVEGDVNGDGPYTDSDEDVSVSDFFLRRNERVKGAYLEYDLRAAELTARVGAYDIQKGCFPVSLEQAGVDSILFYEPVTKKMIDERNAWLEREIPPLRAALKKCKATAKKSFANKCDENAVMAYKSLLKEGAGKFWIPPICLEMSETEALKIDGKTDFSLRLYFALENGFDYDGVNKVIARPFKIEWLNSAGKVVVNASFP